jgi:cell division protein FtsB
MKKVFFAITVIILLIIVNNLVHSIYDIWQKKDFLTEAEKELSFQKQENQRLKSQLSYSKTEEFIEKEARNKLFMVKRGEQRVLISKESEKPQEEKTNDSNWKQWWNLFF